MVRIETNRYSVPEGKVQSYMAVGKSVIVAINGSCSNFIINNKIGYSCSAPSSGALANLIRNIDINELQSIGVYFKEVYLKKYSKPIFMDRLISTLKSMKR